MTDQMISGISATNGALVIASLINYFLDLLSTLNNQGWRKMPNAISLVKAPYQLVRCIMMDAIKILILRHHESI